MRLALSIVAICLVIPLLYGAGYRLMLRGKCYESDSASGLAGPVRPFYWYENKAIDVIFIPAHAIDRQLRPGHWEPDRTFLRPASEPSTE